MRPFFVTENTGGTDQKFGLSVTQQVFDDKMAINKNGPAAAGSMADARARDLNFRDAHRMAETAETKLEWAGEKRKTEKKNINGGAEHGAWCRSQ